MWKPARSAFTIWFGAALLLLAGALPGCSSRAGGNDAGTSKARATMVFYAMPG